MLLWSFREPWFYLLVCDGDHLRQPGEVFLYHWHSIANQDMLWLWVFWIHFAWPRVHSLYLFFYYLIDFSLAWYFLMCFRFYGWALFSRNPVILCGVICICLERHLPLILPFSRPPFPSSSLLTLSFLFLFICWYVFLDFLYFFVLI